MQSPEGLAAEMRAAGFRDVTVRECRHDWRFSSPERFVRDVVWNPLFVAVFEELGPGSEERVCSRLLRSLRERFGTGVFSLRADALAGIDEK